MTYDIDKILKEIYSNKKLGKRIKTERNKLGISQTELAVKLNYSEESRQSVGKWEKGELIPSFETLLRLCNIFQCELGYLLCEYDCKTRAATDIQKTTGLSESAIESLSNIKHQTSICETLGTLSKIIAHKDFTTLLMAMHIHILDFNNNMFRIDEEDSKTIVKIMNCLPQNVESYMQASSKSHIEATIMKIIDDLR